MIGLYDMGSDKRADRLDGLLPKMIDALFQNALPVRFVPGGFAVYNANSG